MTLGSRTVLTLLTSALSATVTAAALASPVAATAAPAADRTQPPLPASIDLPDGFQPEGIATTSRFGYFGSRADGDIYRANLTTGRGKVISQGPGTPSLGLKVGPRDRLYVAGGSGGDVRIVSTRTGRVLRSLTVTTQESFVNDVVLTHRAAFFTDSSRATLYRVPIFRDGRLPRQKDIRRIRLRGDWEQPAGGEIGANGITLTPRGKALLVVNSTDGTLFRVPRTGRQAGVAQRVRLGGASLTNGDGMLLEGRKLFVVRNQLNRVVVLRVGPDGERGRRLRAFTSPAFDVPTTIARSRGALYLPNARFSTEPTPTTTYDVTRVERG